MNIWRRNQGGAERAAGLEARLMTRQGCCLGDEAQQVLQKQGLKVTQVDIEQEAELRALYTDCVPVVFIDGKERFRGRVDPVLLRRLIEANRSRPSDANTSVEANEDGP